MTLVRVHNFAVSLDGFGTGEGQTAEAHFGHAGDRLHEWMFATRWWQAGGSGGGGDPLPPAVGTRLGARGNGGGEFGPPPRDRGPARAGGGGPDPPLYTPG